MLIVNKKWFARSLLFLTILLVALLLATTALAQGPERKGPPGGPPGPPGKMEMPGKHGGACSVISGMVWYDGNGNMEFEPNENRPRRGEHPMDGAVVVLKALPYPGPHPDGPAMKPDEKPMKPEGKPMKPGYYPAPAPHFFGSTTARDGGYYKFECVPPGLYVLEVTPPPSHVFDRLSLKHNPTKPFVLMGGEKKVISFGFKVWLPFPGAELNDPPRLDP
ncbi:MAG: hypothetical protein R3293_08440 [Candidatus Promineifilaceae bacterium]|nr:hypothetical protein [Candidatus Promineifilaceae bacterium]